MKKKLFLLLIAAFFLLTACSGEKTVKIWTDQPVFALYAAQFNAAQDRYKAEVVYFDAAAWELTERKPARGAGPDIVIAERLTSAGSMALFTPILPYIKTLGAADKLFYTALLENGRQKNKQLLLPVSFDMNILFFDRSNIELVNNPFTITLDEIRTAGAAYNSAPDAPGARVWNRIGFSPFWNEEFLFLTASLHGADWREAAGAPLSWNTENLDDSINFLRDWVISCNDSFQADDDFSFKYFFEPPDRLASDGKILFSLARASYFFKLSAERRRSLDFRFIEHDGKILPVENTVYMGVYNGASSKKACAAFITWFYSEETQRLILERSKNLRVSENVFGIADGFSALRRVTENIYPEIYPKMLGHSPPADKLVPPGVYPPFFPEMKERVVIPFLREKIRAEDPSKPRPLELRMADWVRSG